MAGFLRVPSIMLSLCLLIILGSCSSNSSQPDAEQTADPGAWADMLNQVPFPDPFATGEGKVASLPAANTVDGKDSYDESDNSTENGNSRDFNAGAGKISWAIYEFQGVYDWSEMTGLSFEFPEVPETYYVGIADFSKGQWFWLTRGTENGSEGSPDFTDWPEEIDGVSAGGHCYTAAVFFDGASGTVDTATVTWQTDENGPKAELEASPDKGNASLQVFFDASGTTDADAVGISNYEWDWEGDGIFDESGPDSTVDHIYSSAGEYFPVVRATDEDDGLTDTAQVQILVQGWSHSFGTSDDDVIFDVATQQDHIYLVGRTAKDGPDYDGLIISYTAEGQQRWQKTWGDAPLDRFFGVAAIYGGGFVAVGETTGFGVDGIAALVVRFDELGNEVWARIWDTPGTDVFRGVSIDLSDNIWVTGTSDGLQIGDDTDGVVLKYSPDGDVLAEKSLQGGGNIVCNAIEASLFAGIFVVGSSEAYTATPVAAVWNLNQADGGLNKDIGMESSYQTAARDLVTNLDGDVFITGTYGPGAGSTMVAKVNSSAEFEWARGWAYGDYSIGRAIQLRYGQFGFTTDVYVGGDTYDEGESAVLSYLLHFEPDGTYTGAKSWLAENGPITYGMAHGKLGTMVMAGQGTKAAATQSSINYPADNFIILDTYADMSSSQDVNATKSAVSSVSVPLEGVHDTGGGNSDSWVTAFIPEDL